MENKTAATIIKPLEKKVQQQKRGVKTPKHQLIVEFVEYNDDGDYELFNARKGNKTYSFLNAADDNRNLLRGDIVKLTLKNDTIYIAGDGDAPQETERIVSVKKIKDGNVSKFRKGYQKVLKYYSLEEDKYSKSYLDKLYLIVEYYVANTKNDLLKLQIKDRNDLIYSIESLSRADKEYTMIGISTEFEHKTNIVQWLYFDTEKDLLYEYDLPNDQLIEFNM